MLDLEHLNDALPYAQLVFCEDMKASNALCDVTEYGGTHACLWCYFSRFSESRPEERRGFENTEYKAYSKAVHAAAQAENRRPEVKDYGNV